MKRGSKRNRQLDLYVGTPLLNLLATFHRRHTLPSNIQRIGLICSPALGDTLLFSAPLQDIRAAYPNAHITHFCMKQNLAAAEIIPGADTRILISLTSPAATIRTMRAQRCDVLIDFTGWQRLTAFYTLMAGARFTAGFMSPGQRRSRGYDLTIDHTRTRHELANFRALLRGTGLITTSAPQHEPAVTPNPGTPTAIPAVADIVVFHPWASGQKSWLREWPQPHWIALAKRLARPNTLFLVTGAPSDEPLSTPFVAALTAAGVNAQSFVSPDGFHTLTHLLRRARLVVSVNTGVMHLAAIAGAPTISINGPTAEHRWGARGPHVANVQPPDGSGGYLHFGFEFENQPEDIIERITVDQVDAAAATLSAA